MRVRRSGGLIFKLPVCLGYGAIGVAAGILCYELRIPWIPSIAAIGLLIAGMMMLRRVD
jgi:hypothetical protein